MIYTSYWANISRLRRNNIEPVAVSRGKPKGFIGRSIESLAPTWQMLHMDDEMFYREYEKILAKNDPHDIVRWLGNGDVALLCWEKDPSECHRSRIAEWLKESGYEVEEYSEKEAGGQLSFF